MNHGQSNVYRDPSPITAMAFLSIMKQRRPMTLLVPEVAAEVIKDLVNTVRSYDTENEHDVCGW